MADTDSKTIETDRKRRTLGLSEKVLLALALGVGAGVFFGEMVGWLKLVGDIFIRLLQISVIPYISLSLITAIGGLKPGDVKSLAVKGGSIVLVIWALAVVIIMLMPLAYPSWTSASFFSTNLVEEAPKPDFLRLFIPSNPFFAYTNALVPAVVVFSILVGLALINIPSRSRILEPLSVLQDVMMRMTRIVAALSPIGVFALIASAVGTTSIEDLARLQVYIVIYSLMTLTLAFVVLPGLITVFTPFEYKDIVSALRAPMITAFATGSSLIILPMLIERCKDLIADSGLKRRDQEGAELSVEVLIPTFYTFPSLPAVLSLSFVLFGGWYIGSEISPVAYPILILSGIPTLFGGTVLTIPFLLDMFKLPSDLFQVFLSVDVIASRFGTLLGAMHYAAIGLIGITAMSRKIRVRWTQLLKVGVLSIGLVVILLALVRGFYSNVVVVQYSKDSVLQNLRLLEPTQAAAEIESPSELSSESESPTTLQQIRERGVLRVCFQSDEFPSAFFNSADPPQLVGFDIEMAHRLARRMRVPLEFVPTNSETEAASLLDRGVCDVYMRTLPATLERTTVFDLSSPVYMSSIGLIVRDHRRDEFGDWDTLVQMGASLRIAVEDSADSLAHLRMTLPEAVIIPMQSMDDQRNLLESDGEDVDAIIDMAEEGAAWTLLYPRYNLVVPKPIRRIPVSYAVAHGNTELLNAMNAVLQAERALGSIDSLYDYWMLGGAFRTKEQPRWSIIRDVLGWVD